MRFTSAVFVIGALLAISARADEFRFHHDHVLGTSLDLAVWGTQPQADRAEQVVLGEIERLRRILSTYDPSSEVSRLSAGAMRCSPELIEVLRDYEFWRQRSGGAYNAQLGDLITTWKQAQRLQMLPDEAALADLAARAAQPAWNIEGQTVARLSPSRLNVDSLGKGYIITRSIRLARQMVPDTAGILLNIGGDVRISGRSCLVAVADPVHSQDNATPLMYVNLNDAAISTSGSYERGYDIGGRHYSHILDPRTGHPAAGVAQATVIAPDNTTANALATTLCVLAPQEGLRLVKDTIGAECLIVASDGKQFRTDGFAALAAAAAPPVFLAEIPAALNGWPKDFQLGLDLTLKAPSGGRKAKRPFVAIWVEDEKGKPVRTIAVWGRDRKYLKDLPAWWSFARNVPDLVGAVTRASRPAGRYRVVWDGLDDAGRPVSQGTYKINVEANREHARRVLGSATLDCRDQKAATVVKASAEWEEAPLSFGPREQP